MAHTITVPCRISMLKVVMSWTGALIVVVSHLLVTKDIDWFQKELSFGLRLFQVSQKSLESLFGMFFQTHQNDFVVAK